MDKAKRHNKKVDNQAQFAKLSIHHKQESKTMSQPTFTEIDSNTAFEELMGVTLSEASHSHFDEAEQNLYDYINSVDEKLTLDAMNILIDNQPLIFTELLLGLSTANNVFDYSKHLTLPADNTDVLVDAFEEIVGCKPEDATDSAYDRAESHLRDMVDSLHSFINEESLSAIHAVNLEELAHALHGLATANDIYNLAKEI